MAPGLGFVVLDMKYWEIIADNLSKAGWSWGCVSAVDSHGRTIFIADAHRDDGKRFVERLTAFVELERVVDCCLAVIHQIPSLAGLSARKHNDELCHLCPPSCEAGIGSDR